MTEQNKDFCEDTTKQKGSLDPTEQKTGKIGYKPPISNPYSSALKDEQFTKVDTGFVTSLRQIDEGQPKVKRLTKSQRKKLLIGLGIAALLVLIAFLNRPVRLMVNGERRTYNIGTTAQAILEDNEFDIKPGNFISVAGTTLKEGEGHRFSLTVDGNQIPQDEAPSYRVHGGESLVFSDGEDIYEPYTTKVNTIAPKLEMQGGYGSVAYIAQWGKPTKQEVLTGEVSGDVVDGQVEQAGQNCIIQLATVQPSGSEKLIALTFDDGPSQYTEDILNILAEHDAKATFFCLGSHVIENPAMSKKIVEQGHQIASHTFSHDQLTSDTPDKVLSEVNTTFDAIEKTTDTKTSIIRPPYGAFFEKTWLATDGRMSASILWTVDSRDWTLPGRMGIVNNCCASPRNGDIILMHDGGGNRSQTVAALPEIITRLQTMGYKLVTLSDLLASDTSIPQEVASCNQTMPEGCVWPTELEKD